MSLGSVRVLIDDEGMTISNPGGFIDGVNLKMIEFMKDLSFLEDLGRTILSPPVDLLNYLFKEQKQIYRLQNLLRMSKIDRGNRYQYMC